MTTRDLTDLVLVVLAAGAGAVDAISYVGLGRVFTANMTGNIVLLGVAVGGGATSEVIRSGTAFLAFVAGVLAAILLTRESRNDRSWSAGLKVALGLETISQAALLAGWLASAAHPGNALKTVLVGLSALAMGLQSGAVVALGVGGVSTTYVTGTLTGLIGELATLKGSRRDWARRGLVLVAVLLGAICGGLLLRDARRAAPVLPLVATSLVLVTGAYLLPRARAVNHGD